MIRFTERTPTIAQIYQYTYSNPKVRNRFEYMERDVLKTRIKITKRLVYRKNKESKTMTPDELICVESVSTPQYYPFNKVKTKGAKKQRKIHHQYDCFFAFSKDEDGNYSFWNSRVIFRIGGYKKWETNVPQNKLKSVLKSTRERLEKKYSKLPPKEKQKEIKKQIDKIRQHGIYLDVGDYNADRGLNGDFYFRVASLAEKYDALYGRSFFKELPPSDYADFIFFPKHAIAIINWCLRRGIIKYK